MNCAWFIIPKHSLLPEWTRLFSFCSFHLTSLVQTCGQSSSDWRLNIPRMYPAVMHIFIGYLQRNLVCKLYLNLSNILHLYALFIFDVAKRWRTSKINITANSEEILSIKQRFGSTGHEYFNVGGSLSLFIEYDILLL